MGSEPAIAQRVSRRHEGMRRLAGGLGGRGRVRFLARIRLMRGKSRHRVSSTSKFTVGRDARRKRPRRRNRPE